MTPPTNISRCSSSCLSSNSHRACTPDSSANRNTDASSSTSHFSIIPSTFSSLDVLLKANEQWAKNMVEKKPDFFLNLTISDSRVPANQIVNLEPGEVFVHRNISNIVLHTDLNCLSVLQYAVDVLKVKHVIVCGHYGCGGVIAAMNNQQFGLIDNWLRAVKDIYHANEEKLDKLPDTKSQIDLMCELNVAQSVKNVCATTIVQNAWHRSQELSVHGWCYRIEDGIIRDLDICVTNPDQVFKVYKMVAEKKSAHV
ncbi:hypothetical protein HMI55_002123 [Coelomomyces lativittatus]|nr:hypothetical protein HMI55_002123 [Coelomomyces lativittatus]